MALVYMGKDLGHGLVAKRRYSAGNRVARFMGKLYRHEEAEGTDVSTLGLQDEEEQHVARLDAETVLVTTKAIRQKLLSQGPSQDCATFAQHSPYSNVRLKRFKNELWLVANEDIAPGKESGHAPRVTYCVSCTQEKETPKWESNDGLCLYIP